MATDPLQAFYQSVANEQDSPFPTGEPEIGIGKKRTGFDTIMDGAQQGAEGLGADLEYFDALYHTLTGDKSAVAHDIERARQYEENAANATAGMDSFEEFLDEPTITGLFEQALKFGGQALPSLATTIAGGGIGGIVASGLKAGGTAVTKATAKRIVKDSIERTAKGIATPDERDLANSAWRTFRHGALGGAFAAEYAPLAGQNVNEALESGVELDRGAALRAATVAVPQGIVGVGGEVAILKLIGNVAGKRAVKEGGKFANLSKQIAANFAKSGAIEATTETVQEGIAIANRMSMDEEYSAQDVKLRLAEAAFGGFMGGGPVGGAGTAIAGAARMVADGGVLDTTAEVFDKARRMVDSARESKVNKDIDDEQYGDVMSGNTTPEARSDINAQLEAMVDPSSTKTAVWDAGDTPSFDARTRVATEITVNGEVAWAAFVPGRGTIVSTDKNIVNEVVASGASDSSLSIALGYTKTKSEVGDGDVVVQAFDKEGNIVSEELTSQDNVGKAYVNAEGIAPEGGRVVVTSVEKALEERKKRFEREKGPEVRAMDEEALSQLQEWKDNQGSGIQVEEASEETVTGTFKAKSDPSKVFGNTEQARSDYEAVFGEQDWSNPDAAAMSESTLNEAVRQQRANRNAIVSVRRNSDGQFEVVRNDFAGNLIEVKNPHTKQVERLTLSEFLPRIIQIAKQSKFSRGSGVQIVLPDGTRQKINLVDLTRAGQRLAAARGDGQFEGQTPFDSAQRGLQEILVELQLEGYDVIVSGESIFGLGNQQVPDYQGNATAAIIDGVKVPLGDLLKPRETIGEGKPETVLAEEVDTEGRPTGEVVGSQSGTDAAMDAFEAFQKETMGRETRRVNEEFDPDERLDETDGRSEIDRALDKPETAQDVDRQADRRTGRAPQTGPSEQIAGITDTFLVGLIKSLLKAIKLKNEPKIYSLEILANFSEQQLADRFPNELDRQAIRDVVARLQDKQSIKGQYLKGQNVIIVNPTGNALNDALVLAHELGHALFAEEMAEAVANPALRTRLMAAFKKSHNFQKYTDAYGYELGFEEWYADQVARWATKKFINKQARSLTDKHFKYVANRLKKLYRELNRNVKRRFGKLDQDFETYIDAVVEAKREGMSTSDPNFVQRALVQDINKEIVRMGGEGLADHWRAVIREIARNPKLRPLMKFVRTADSIMRAHGGQKIANMFYIRAQDSSGGGGLGMVAASGRQIAEFQNQFEKEIGTFDDPEVQAALAEAASSKPTNELSPKAQQVRKFLDSVYDNYIAPSNTDIGRQENYFPTALDLAAIQENVDAFVELIIKNDPTANEKDVRKSINAVLKYNQSIADGKPIEIDPTNPASAAEQALRLTLNVDREVLQEAGFLHEPQDAFVQYLRHIVKRVEWNTATKDENGNSILDEEIQKLGEEDQEIVREIIGAYLGYQSNPLSPFWRKVNSYGQFLQFITILPFAAIASLPELAGPVINSKEFADIATGFKQIAATIKNRAEAKQFARDIGVVTSEVVANSWVTQAEQDYMESGVRKMSDVFFKAIGLSWFTNFTREYAAGMGVQFITKHARNEFNNPRSERYLAELGLTAAEVKQWMKDGRKFTTPEGKKVKRGLQRFVESSILRPNAAERPIWASDPHWALVWQLKSYFYSYTKVIMGGIYREMKTRRQEMDNKGMPQLTATLAVLAITAIATMPLAMLAMEVREYAKQGLAWILPGVETDNRYFRSDRMDWPTYLSEIVDRSGFLGVLTLFAMAHQNMEWDKGGYTLPDVITPFLGPTVETIDTALENGFRVDRTLKDRLLPVYNQL